MPAILFESQISSDLMSPSRSSGLTLTRLDAFGVLGFQPVRDKVGGQEEMEIFGAEAGRRIEAAESPDGPG